MITFFYHPSPNPAKVALFLEEAQLEYTVVPIDTRKGEQFEPEYLAINPNGKTPALIDGDVTLFDSNAILLYLAEKSGQFLGEGGGVRRAEILSWLMFIATGIGPYSGQAVHFKHFAPEPKDYALNRYTFEAERHWNILEARLATRRYVAADAYTIVDMALWGWARAVPFIFGEGAWERLPNIKRAFDATEARPAVARVDALASRHRFKTDMDDEARRHMFPQNGRLVVA